MRGQGSGGRPGRLLVGTLERDEQLLDIAEQIGTQLGRVVERSRSEAALRLAYDEPFQANDELTREFAERTRAEEALSHMAFHDTLTDLPNRALLLDRTCTGESM